MRKYSKREMKDFLRLNLATDITNLEDVQDFVSQHPHIDKEGYTFGTYGISGGILKDSDTGEIFVITKRNSVLLYFF